MNEDPSECVYVAPPYSQMADLTGTLDRLNVHYEIYVREDFYVVELNDPKDSQFRHGKKPTKESLEKVEYSGYTGFCWCFYFTSAGDIHSVGGFE